MQRLLLDLVPDGVHLTFHEGGGKHLAFDFVSRVLCLHGHDGVPYQRHAHLTLQYVLGVGRVFGDKDLVELVCLVEEDSWRTEHKHASLVWHILRAEFLVQQCNHEELARVVDRVVDDSEQVSDDWEVGIEHDTL